MKDDKDLKPREKACKYGISMLSDEELMAILLRFGSDQNPVEKLSKLVIQVLDKKNNTIGPEDLTGLKGIGPAKATTILAAIEFSRRRLCPLKNPVIFPSDVLPAIRHIASRPQEHFISVTLNGANEIINTRTVSIGTSNKTIIHPRDVFAHGLLDHAASMILAHNHPSGNLAPSNEDIRVTDRLTEAGELLGIRILDHIIFSDRDYYSFAENLLLV